MSTIQAKPTLVKVSNIRKKEKRMPTYVLIYYFILVLVAITIIIPFIWMLSASFDRVNTYELPYPPRFIPANFSSFNYKMVITNMQILVYLKNTIIVAIMSLIFQLILTPMCGFAFSKGCFPGKSIILIFILSNLMVPFETKLSAIYNIVKNMGLSNTYLGIVLPGVMTSTMFIFFMKKFCDDLPYDLYESGVLDGASKLRIFLQIYLPLMGPALATIAVLDVMNTWNDLLWPMIVVNKHEMSTIQVGLAMFSSDASGINRHAGMTAAASMLSIIPLALVFIFLQRYIVESIAVTGIKQ